MTIYKCDFCDTEFESMSDINDVKVDFDTISDVEVDLCARCAKWLREYILSCKERKTKKKVKVNQ